MYKYANRLNAHLPDRMMYLSEEGASQLIRHISLHETPSVVLFMHNGRECRRVQMEHNRDLTTVLDKIEKDYGMPDDGFFDVLDEKENEDKKRVAECKAEKPEMFPHDRALSVADQAAVLRETGIHTGAVLVYSGERHPIQLFAAFKKLVAALNKDDISLPGAIYANFRHYPKRPFATRIQVAVNEPGQHHVVLAELQQALQQCPFRVYYKWDALRHASLRYRDRFHEEGKSISGAFVACKGIITDPIEELTNQVDEILELV